jgi:diacylglycerol kinase family enzyme
MAAPETRTQQAAVVYNPIKVDLPKLKKAVAATQKAAGWRASLWLPTTEEEIGTSQARQAIKAGVDVVLAAGGDGTVRAVAEGLQGSGVALALLPSGTGNLLARNLDIPVTQLDASIDTAFNGVDRPIDVGVIDLVRPNGTLETHSFVVLAGLGIDAKMLANTNAELKKRVGWLAYVDAIVRSLRDSEKVRMRYRIDGGEERTASVHTVLIGNVGLLPGNLVLLPDAEPDDGLFDIVALRPEGFGGWAQIWLKIVWENGVLRRSSVGRQIVAASKPVRTLQYLRARRVSVRLDKPEEFELDGDEFGKVRSFDVRIEPGSLVVRVAAPAE